MCGQAGSFVSERINALADGFHGDLGLGGNGDKFREGISQGDGDHLFGRGPAGANGADPGAEWSTSGRNGLPTLRFPALRSPLVAEAGMAYDTASFQW